MTARAIFSPMLAADWLARAAPHDFAAGGVIGQPKFDGWRALYRAGEFRARGGGVIAHPVVIEAGRRFAALGAPPLDGELIAGEPDRPAPDLWRATSSILRREHGDAGALRFVAFDCLADPDEPCAERLARLSGLPLDPFLRLAPSTDLETAAAVAEFEQLHYCRGFEGVILRDPAAPYAPGGRDLAGPIWKWKRFTDDEATITGAAPMQSKGATVEKVGAFLCDWRGRAISIGAGIPTALRAELWPRRAALIGAPLRFRFQGVYPSGLPRNPVFIGLRDRCDMPAKDDDAAERAAKNDALPRVERDLVAFTIEQGAAGLYVVGADPLDRITIDGPFESMKAARRFAVAHSIRRPSWRESAYSFAERLAPLAAFGFLKRN